MFLETFAFSFEFVVKMCLKLGFILTWRDVIILICIETGVR